MSSICKNCGWKNTENFKYCNGCGAILDPSPQYIPLNTGSVIGQNYEITGLLKLGNYGGVYKALNTMIERSCIIKEYLLLNESSVKTEETVKEFYSRSKALAKLDHANLAAISNFFIHNKRAYLVMKYIDGENFRSILKNKNLTEKEVLNYTRQILQAIDYLHNESPPLIHGDINPGNIMLHKDGRVFLIDFYLEDLFTTEEEGLKISADNPAFSPAEIFEGLRLTQSDIYSLGGTMNFLLTGSEPTEPFSFPSLKQYRPELSPKIISVINKALSPSPGERYQNAREMIKAIDENIQSTELVHIQKSIVKKVSSGTWGFQKQGSGDWYYSVFFQNPQCGWIADNVGKIFYTSDGGYNWEEQKTGTMTWLRDIQFIDGELGWAVGHGLLWGGSILSSNNAGNTWTRQVSKGLCGVHFIDPLTGWAAGNKGLILYTEDGGKSWTEQKTGTKGDLYKIYFIDSLRGWAVGGGILMGGIILHTENGGANWKIQRKTDFAVSVNSIFFLDDSHGWAVTSDGCILQTKDRGHKWRAQNNASKATLYDVQFVDLYNGWAVGEKGTILYTRDGGTTWSKEDCLVDATLSALSFPDLYNGWIVGDKGTILKYSA